MSYIELLSEDAYKESFAFEEYDDRDKWKLIWCWREHLHQCHDSSRYSAFQLCIKNEGKIQSKLL